MTEWIGDEDGFLCTECEKPFPCGHSFYGETYYDPNNEDEEYA
jgi:hypothetical protein